MKLIDIFPLTNPESGKIPTKIRWQLGYFQLSKTNKKLINSKLYFEDYVKPSIAQQSGSEPFIYSLIFSYQALTHSQIINEFSFDWPVYFICYISVCVCGVTINVIVLTYHIIFTT